MMTIAIGYSLLGISAGMVILKFLGAVNPERERDVDMIQLSTSVLAILIFIT
jgi:hypothetical protein